MTTETSKTKYRKDMQKMKKIFAILVILLALAGPTQAQIFIVDAEENLREGEIDPAWWWPFIPGHDAEWDQGYAPVGSGAALLIGFGAAYLLANKKKK